MHVCTMRVSGLWALISNSLESSVLKASLLIMKLLNVPSDPCVHRFRFLRLDISHPSIPPLTLWTARNLQI
jgi:hypothetical protein